MANIRLLSLCTIIGLLAILDIAKPIDLFLDGIGNKMLSKNVSGEIVKVEFDGSTLSGRRAAEALLDAGADGVLAMSPSDMKDDPTAHKIAATYHTHRRADGSTFDLNVEWWRGIETVRGLGSGSTPIELLANSKRSTDELSIRVDYSFEESSIPVYSYDSIVSGIENLSNKQVVLVDEYRLWPEFNVPGRPAASTSTILILGAETLKENTLATVPAFILATFFSILCYIALTRRKVSIFLTAFSFTFFISLSFLALRYIGYYSGVGLSILAIFLVAAHVSNKRNRERSFDSSFRHQSALSTSLSHLDADIVAASINSYRSFKYGTDPKDMAKFVREIERRLSIAAAGSEIFELEPGVFAWSMRTNTKEELQDHLDAARLIIKEPIVLGDRQLSLSVAYGVETDRDRLLTERFHSALLTARDAQKDGLAFKISNFAEIEARKEDTILIGELDDAIKDNCIHPVFQPKLCLETLKVVGFEALARWNHPRRGPISPGRFVPLVEASGKSPLLARHMLFVSLKEWSELNLNIPVSVNISPTSLMSDSFIEDVKSALSHSEMPAKLLVLEIIETEALSYNSKIEERLQDLCDLGVQLSIDDFGTGYSTLDNVRRLPAKELKLDKKFIDDIGTNDISARLVSTTYRMGTELGLSVVAEGIETLEQLAMLQAIGIHVGQGYYFAKPMPASEIEGYLSSIMRRSETA